MKRTFLLLALIVTLGTVAQAQVSIIPKGGVAFTNVNYDQDLAGQKSKTGFVAGLGINFPITSDNFFSIQPELLYVQQGFRATAGDYKVNYVNVPLLLKVNFGMENVPIYVNAGPAFGYALSGSGTDGDNAFSLDDVNRLDIGLQFGGGVGFGVGPGSLLLDARYGFGLTNLYNLEGAPDSENKSKNNVFQFTLGYAIPFGGD